MDRAFQPSRKYPRRPGKSGLVDGFAEENAIFGGYNQSAASASAELASGNLRLLDNFTLYVQTDDEGSEELVDLQDLHTDGVHGLPLKATGTVLDHRLCSQQSVYDARSSSKIKVRVHYIRDWVVDYSTPVTVWLITDWAWYRLLSPSRIYKQQYQSVGPVLGRHALKSFLVTLADRAGLQLTDFVGTGRKLTTPSDQSLAADIRRRPAPQTSFLVPREAVPSLLLVWDFCQRYAALLRLPPFPFLRLQLACLDKPPPLESDLSLTPSPTQHTRQPERSPTSCKECDASFSSTKALREHCSLSGHDPTRASKSSKQKLSLVSVQPAVPLELSVEPIPDQVEMERWGATGQGRLLCDIHSALIRVLEGLDEDLMEAPTMAGYGSAVDLAPQDAFRPLLGASWPELARRYLQDHGPLTVSQDAVEAVLRLKVTEYNQLSVHDRALILEGLVTIVANTELLRNHLRHLEPEGATPVLNRGAVMGQDSAGNIYHQLGGPSARGSLYVEAAEGQAWGWYSPHQIPSLIAWLETGSQQEQQLAEELYTMYQPVLRLVAQPGQASGSGLPPLQELWQPSAPSKHHLTVSPEALQQPRDGYKGSQPGSGWGRRRGWFREQLEATRNVAQAAALGGQLAAHCRREGDLGLVTPQELLQSAQRQRCYLGYIPQPPQDVVLFKSGYEAHVRQQERSVPAIPAWLESWAPMQDCKVKQMACVVEHLPASQRQASLRSQSQPGFPPRVIEPPCTAWLLLEKEPSIPQQGSSDEVDEEIDWTHFTFQHGFRQLLHHLQHHLGPPSLAAPPTQDLVPKKIRQARPVQRPARLLNNALEDGSSMNLNEAERAPALPAAPAMLPGEDRIRFWRKERSLLAVALHVKPGMTRAAEFLVPVQLCNRALSVAWPLGMPVKMPFTGTVLDHLTKPRPDTRVGLGAGAAVHEADPWNALDVLWDSDTPPGWPKMVCPWQVMEDRGGELRKAKERYRQAEAEKREKARQENLVREANRRATAERQQQAAAALQAERMRRALEARAVVAQVAEQKEADRAALAAVQGGAGQSVTGPQLLASVVPRSTAAGAVSSVGLPSAPAASAAAAGLSASSAFSQQMMQQLQGGAAAHQLPPQAQYPTQPAAGSQSHALHPASHAMAAAPLAQHHSSYQYPQAYTHPQMGSSSGTHAGQMGAMDSVQDTAVLQGVAPAAALSGQQHAAGVLSAAGGNASGEGTPAGTPGSSPAETENSALGKRGRSADADEQSSPPRAKKAKPAAEGYRERWLAGKPRAQCKTWCSMLCCVCEQGSDDFELLVCKGPCLRAFHPACLGMTPQAVINPASQAAWFCPECLHGRVRCFVCGEFGAGFEDPTVRKCSLGVCGRFYHIKCAQALELTQMAKKGAHFRCPQHYCAVCRKSGDGVDMVKCIRCPTAYHSSCMPKDIQRLLPHAKVVLCSNHVDQPLAPYQHPPAPDPNKLEAAQQQGKAMGLPPVKAKSGHASGSGTGFSSPDQRQSGSQQADVPQESVSGQGAGLTNPAAAGEAVPVGAATIQSSQYTDNTQGEQQAFLQAGPSAPGSLPPLQQLQTQPGLPSAAAIPAEFMDAMQAMSDDARMK
ncbi:hypothetical protein WJX79_000733 [Trebouxia sp. C0005]